MRRLVLCDRHLLIRRELAACAARHLMQHIRAEGQVLRDRVAGGVRSNAVALGRVGVGIAACGFEVHFKNRALLGHVVAVHHVGVLRDADLIQLHLLLYRDSDLIVLEGEFSGRRADRVSRAVELVAGGGRDFLDVPVIAADVLLRRELPIGICGVLIDQVIAAVHAVDCTRKRGVALRSTGRAVALRNRGRPFFEDVRKGNSRGLIGLDRDRLRLRLHVLVGGELRHGQHSAGLQVRNGDGAVGGSLHRGVHAVARDVEAYTGDIAVLRGLDDL